MAMGAATKVGSVYMDVTANTIPFRTEMAKTDAIARQATSGVRSQLAKTEVETHKLTSAFRGMHGALAAIAGAVALHELVETADAFSLMRSRIRLVTQAGEDMYAIEEKLARQAFTNRANLKETVGLYTRLRQSRSDLSDEGTRELVDKWSKSLIVSASSAQEAASSTQQFAQAMAAGVLSGQELRSVIQGNSAFAVYLAQGLGIATGELKQMGEEGKLTVDTIFKALAVSGDAIEHDFAKKALTVHQALTNVETATIRLIGLSDQAMGFSATLAGWVNALAGAIETTILYAKGSTPEIERMRAQTDKLRGTIKETDAIIEKGGLRKLGDQAAEAMPQLTEVEEKIKAIQDRLAEGGKGEKIRAVGQLEGGILEQIIAIERLQAALRDLQGFRLQKRGDGGFDRVRNGTSDQIANATKELRDAEKALAESQARLADLRKAPSTDFRKPIDRAGVDILQTQLALELARAQGKDKEVARLEDIIMREKLIADYVEKKLTTEEATAKATAHVAALRKAINAGNEKERAQAEAEANLQFQLAIAQAEGDKVRIADLESQLEINRRANDLEEQGVEATLARARATEEVNRLKEVTNAVSEKELAAARELRDLEYQRALAERDGNDAQVRALQRELDIRREMKALTDTGYGETEARVIATQRVDSLMPKDPSAWDGFEQGIADATKRGLIDAIETGDWADAFGEILTDVTRDALSRALDVLWEALSQIDWGGQGTGWGGFFDMVGSSFQPRSGGGPVKAGSRYRVGELGSEWFIPKTDGMIVPNGGFKQQVGAAPSINVGGAQIVINGNADSVTVDQLAAALTTYQRMLPSQIRSEIADRRMREGW